MAKKRTSVRHQVVNKKGNRGVQVEQHEFFDDNLLPDAEELFKLKELDPTVIDWIKERAEKEQDARIRFNDSKTDIVKKSQRDVYITDMVSLSFGFIIMLSGMFSTLFLFYFDKDVIGSLFGAGTLIIAVKSFLGFNRFKNKDKN